MAMLPELTPVNQSSVPMEITEFMEDLVQKAEEIQEENTQLKKKIDAIKKKLEMEKEKETINRKYKIELLTLFRQLMERRANRNKGRCKNCPSLESDLKVVKERITELLREQIKATEKVFNIEQDIKMNEVLVEKSMHEVKEFEQYIEKRKADVSKHFQNTKFNAVWLRQQIEDDLKFEASGDLVLAIQKQATDIAIKKAYDEIPTKIDHFEKATLSEAQNEAKKEIAKIDQGRSQFLMNDYYEYTKNIRREKYMKWI